MSCVCQMEYYFHPILDLPELARVPFPETKTLPKNWGAQLNSVVFGRYFFSWPSKARICPSTSGVKGGTKKWPKEWHKNWNFETLKPANFEETRIKVFSNCCGSLQSQSTYSFGQLRGFTVYVAEFHFRQNTPRNFALQIGGFNVKCSLNDFPQLRRPVFHHQLSCCTIHHPSLKSAHPL